MIQSVRASEVGSFLQHANKLINLCKYDPVFILTISIISCKRRALPLLEDEEAEKEATRSSFARRVASAAYSELIRVLPPTSVFRRPNRDELDSSAARGFEWFADGAGEFVRLAELGGGTPRRDVAACPCPLTLSTGTFSPARSCTAESFRKTVVAV